METYNVIYYICETNNHGHDRILASTNSMVGAKEMVKSLRDTNPNSRFFITVRVKDDD